MSLEPSSPDSSGNLAAKISGIWIVVFALSVGLLIIGGFCVYFVHGVNNGQGVMKGDVPFVSIVAAGSWVIGVGVAFLLPKLTATATLRRLLQPDPANPAVGLSDRLFANWAGQLFVSAALKEGPAVIGLVAYVVDAQPFVLVFPVLSIIFLLLSLPTETGFRSWLEEQEQRLRELRDDKEKSDLA